MQHEDLPLSRSILPRVFPLLLLALGCDLAPAEDTRAAGGSTGGGEGPGSHGDDTDSAGNTDNDTDTAAEPADSNGDAADEGGDSSGDGQVDGPLTCSNATLFAGSPYHNDPMERPTEGTGILEDPPLGWRMLVDDRGILYSNVGSEVWSTDLSEDSPGLHKVAGSEFGGGPAFAAGPCGDARFVNLSGVAVMNNGDLIITDSNANSILQVVDPQGADCEVEYVAGTSEPRDAVSEPPNQGEADGPGAAATFRGPKWPVVGADDTIYAVDNGNMLVRAVADDDDRTVSTLADLGVFDYSTTFGMVMVDDSLYVLAQNFSQPAVLEIDVASGDVTELVAGAGDVWLEDGASGASPAGITTDGQSLIVVNHGKVLEITLDGQVSHIAGNGVWQFFSPDYDARAEHDAADVELLHSPGRAATAHANAFAHYMDGALFYVGDADGIFVERIDCTR